MAKTKAPKAPKEHKEPKINKDGTVRAAPVRKPTTIAAGVLAKTADKLQAIDKRIDKLEAKLEGARKDRKDAEVAYEQAIKTLAAAGIRVSS